MLIICSVTFCEHSSNKYVIQHTNVNCEQAVVAVDFLLKFVKILSIEQTTMAILFSSYVSSAIS